MRVFSALILAGCLASCAPGLSNPDRFRSEQACDLDVLEHLLIPSCAGGTCHDAEHASSDLEFTTGAVADRLVGVEAIGCPGHLLVDPANPSASFLLERLRPDASCDGVPLDRLHGGGLLLSETELDCVSRWVESLGTDAPDAAVLRDGGVGTVGVEQ